MANAAQNNCSEPIAFPSDAESVVDVSAAPYHCDPTGRQDCTAALIQSLDDVARLWRDGLRQQAAFYDEHPFEYEGTFEARKAHGHIFLPHAVPAKILYFPPGTYLISDTLRYTLRDMQNCNGFELPNLIQFRGAGQEHVTIKLADRCLGFEAGRQRAVIDVMGGIYTNAAFHNSVEDLTVDLGDGNPGAVGVGFFCNNTGTVRNLTVRAGEGSGHCGLTLRHRNASNALLQHITVEGCDYGVHVGYDRLSTTLEHITVRGQRRAGVHVDRHNVSLRGLISDNSVPALLVTGHEAVVAFVEGELRGGSAEHPAIDMRDGHLFVRDVQTDGYRCALQHQGGTAVAESSIDEFVNSDVAVLFPEESRRSLRLPIEDTPHIPWPAPEDWACVNDFGAVGDGEHDDTDAIRAALNSGKAHVHFQNGIYLISDIIDVPGNVERINFMKCDLAAAKSLRLQHGVGAFRVHGMSERPLIIEDLFAMEAWRGGMALVEHACTRTLVLSDIHMHFCAAYRNSVPGGKVFIENVFAMNQFRREIPVFDFQGQQVWARSINPERNDPEIRNDGGDLWILGFKTEGRGTAFETRGGGRTEVLGGTCNQHYAANSPPVIINDRSEVSVVCGFTDYKATSYRGLIAAQETRGEYTRKYPVDHLPKRDGVLPALPLYVGRAREG